MFAQDRLFLGAVSLFRWCEDPGTRGSLHICAAINEGAVFDQIKIPNDLIYRQVRIDAFKREYVLVGKTFNPDTRSVASLQLQDLLFVTVRMEEAFIEVEIIK